VEVGTLDFLNSSASDFTISMWVKPTSRDRGMPFTAGPTNWIYIYYFPVGSYNEFRYKIRGSATQSTIPNLTSENEITPNKWYHITLTSEGTVAKFYLNGDLLHTGVSGTSYLNSGDNVMIGKWGYTANYEFHGLINSASIFDYALSESQVTTLYGTESTIGNPMALPSPPIAYYPLGGSAGAFRIPVNVDDQWLIENNAIGDYVFNFSGSNAQSVNCGNDNSLQATTALTLSAWIKYTTDDTNFRYVLTRRDLNDTNYMLYLNNTTGSKTLKFGSNGTATSSGSVTYNQWHHVAVTVNGTSVSFYIDGQPAGTSTITGINSFADKDFIIGDVSYSTTYEFAGLISNPKMFNIVLSPTEIQTLYNYGSPIQTLANIPQNSNLKAWYKCGKPSRTT